MSAGTGARGWGLAPSPFFVEVMGLMGLVKRLVSRGMSVLGDDSGVVTVETGIIAAVLAAIAIAILVVVSPKLLGLGNRIGNCLNGATSGNGPASGC